MLEIKVEGLDKIESAIRKNPKVVFEELSKGIETGVNFIRPIMRQKAPHKSGEMSKNIYARAVGLKGEVGPNLNITPYAWYVHKGTDPHIIRPNKKKALYWPGAKHPVKKVKHPGSRPQPFVDQTFKEVQVPVQGIFQQRIDNIINRFHKG